MPRAGRAMDAVDPDHELGRTRWTPIVTQQELDALLGQIDALVRKRVPAVLTAKELAGVLGAKPRTVVKWCQTKRIDGYNIYRQMGWRITAEAARRFVTSAYTVVPDMDDMVTT